MYKQVFAFLSDVCEVQTTLVKCQRHLECHLGDPACGRGISRVLLRLLGGSLVFTELVMITEKGDRDLRLLA